MKIFVIYSCCLLFISVVNAQQQRGDLDNILERFVEKMTYARLAEISVAELMIERGKTPEIREYGAVLVKDNSEMLANLKKIAASKNKEIPTTTSTRKARTLKKIKHASDREFDKKILSLLEGDHKRDINELQAGIDSQQNEVAAFSQLYLPTLESHLKKVNELQKIK